jgi:hypothetical protein
MRECAKCGRCFEDSIVVCPDDNSAVTSRFPGPAILNQRYRLEQLLGSSSLGRVYLAQDENLVGREVAVRVFERSTIPTATWDRLAVQLASVQSENVVEITDFGVGLDDSYFVVMNRMVCETLFDLVERSPRVQLERAVTLLKQVAVGVAAIHERGLLHGALSPNNVFLEIRVTTFGGFAEEETVKVSDFGWDAVRTLDETRTNSGPSGNRRELGITEFLAPEQVQPGATVDARADVYGLGALAYFVLSGQPPFSGDILQVVVQKTMGDPRPLEAVSPEVSASISAVVMAALRRDPDVRTGSIAALIAGLESAAASAGAGARIAPRPGISVKAPEGSTVYLDDAPQGNVDFAGAFSILLVESGVHLVRVRYPNGTEDERLVELGAVADGETVTIEFEPIEGEAGRNGDERPVSAGIQAESERIMSNNEPGPAPLDGENPASGGGDAVVASEARLDCPKCGTSNRATSKFCRICGASIKPKPVAEQAVVSPPLMPEVSDPPPPAAPEPPPPAVLEAEPVVAPVAVTPPIEPIPAPVVEPLSQAPERAESSSSEIEQARRELEAEEERLRALSDAHRLEVDGQSVAPEDLPDDFETIMQSSLPVPEIEEIPRNQAPTEELEREAPVIAAPARNSLPDTMGGAGGLQVEVPKPSVYRSPGRPKTIETTGTSFDSQLSDAAKGSAVKPESGAERSQSYYLGVGAVLGAIILAILGLIAFVVYWFILSK